MPYGPEDLREDQISLLLSVVKEGNEHEHELAIVALTSFGPAAVPRLVGALSDLGKDEERRYRSDDEFRMSLVRTLGMIADERAVPALTRCLAGLEENESKFLVAEALGRIGTEKALRELWDELPELDPAQWERVMKLFGPIAEKAILAAFTSTDAERIQTAALLAGRLQLVEAFDALKEMLSSPDPVAVAAAATSLGKLGEPKAVSALVEAYDTWRNVKDDDYERRRISEGLRKIILRSIVELKNPVAVKRLLEHASADDGSAMAALVLMGETALEPLLEAIAKGSPAVQKTAAEIVRDIKSGKVTDFERALAERDRSYY